MAEPSDFLNIAIPVYKPSISPPHNLLPPSNELLPFPPDSLTWTDRLLQLRKRLLRRRPLRLSVPFPDGNGGSHAPLYRRITSTVSVHLFTEWLPSQTRRQPAQPRQGPLASYERKLNRTRWAARAVGLAFSLSSFFAFCSLTWATVVLLGAYVSNLLLSDFTAVGCLLILQATQLASAAFFTILLTHGLARLSQDPENIIHGRDDHYQRAAMVRIVSSVVQLVLLLPSLVWPSIRLLHLQDQGIRNLHTSLRIFYILAICNALCSLMTLCFSTLSFFYLRDRYDQSTLRYYDELAQRAISFGVVRADEFAFFEFAYRMLGSEYARIVQPEAVVKNHKQLIQYLYLHRLGQDFLCIFMDAGDAFIQQAAVNMPGFWADPDKRFEMEEVKITPRVLTKLADKVGPGQVGWAACNSFGAIARMDPSLLVRTRMSCGMPLLERLAELIDGQSSASLTYVRTLELFYHYSFVKGTSLPCLPMEKELVQKLKQLLQTAKLMRLRVHSTYLLHLTGYLDVECYDAIDKIRPGVPPDSYWFESEMELFKFIRRQCQMSELLEGLVIERGFIRKEDKDCRNL
ncbi:hypothetical protein KP509_17G066400 [Ceratopteris richardii]|uniref:Uncharacterized protein n=1 Tax=Ceratopteris richardii TaxID=49495 RepID=A0A8T2SWY9_CERRI|nr:hypothetical protein KP509_17G066400 [Ceratopteris richardii]